MTSTATPVSSMVWKRQHCFRRMIRPRQQQQPLGSQTKARVPQGQPQAALEGSWGDRGRSLLRSNSLETVESQSHRGHMSPYHGIRSTSNTPMHLQSRSCSSSPLRGFYSHPTSPFHQLPRPCNIQGMTSTHSTHSWASGLDTLGHQGHHRNSNGDDSTSSRGLQTASSLTLLFGAAFALNKSENGDDNQPNCEVKSKEEVMRIICQGIRLEPETKSDEKVDKEIQIVESEPTPSEASEAMVNPTRVLVEETETQETELPFTIENVAFYHQQMPTSSDSRQHGYDTPSITAQSGPSDALSSPTGLLDPNEVEEENEKIPALHEGENGEEEEEEEAKNGKAKKGKEKIGFRERKVIEYENRMRNFSTPDKIFRYFATYRSIQSDAEIYMTPGDFLRSLTPGVIQPEGLGLDQFRKYDPLQGVAKVQEDLDHNSIFYHLGAHGLISFSDYVFLLTILSTSRRQFEIAFRMFDLNGDGDVDVEEFEKVQEIIRQTTTNGKKHRDHGTTGSTLKKTNTALSNYFFGEDRQGKLTIEKFLEFQSHLQRDILAMEFSRKDPMEESGNISEKQFAELLLTYADYVPKKRSAILKRVKKAFKNSEECHYPGISLEDYINIFYLLMHIEDVEKALAFHNLAGASIDQRTLKHVAKVTAEVELSDHVINVIFTIFDEDGDGGLSNKEFVAVMRNKLKRGLEKPKDTGLFTLFTAITKCALTVKAKVP